MAHHRTPDPRELVRQALAGDESALEQLMPIFRSLATGVARAHGSLSSTVGGMLIGDAPGLLWQKLKEGHYDSTRPFEAWAYVVLRNHFISLCRKERYVPSSSVHTEGDGDFLANIPARTSAACDEAAAARLYDLSRAQRRILDQLSTTLRRQSAVDYYAVLLLRLRVELLSSCREAFDSSDQQLACVREYGVRWRPEEQKLRVRSDLLTLAEIWDKMVSALREATEDNVTAMMCDIMEVSPNTWYKWVSRARKLACACLSTEDQQQLFGCCWQQGG